jgi:hypothetical protein
VYHVQVVRFDYNLLDPWDPFEIDDGNRVHLYKHLLTDDAGRSVVVEIADILDAYRDGDPGFIEAAAGRADWLMLACIPGLVIAVPLARPNSGDVTKCRPIGLQKPRTEDRVRYLKGDYDE